MTDEIGWLVELPAGAKFTTPHWWGPQCSEADYQSSIVTFPLWTNDAGKALRFSRREDAEAFIRWQGLSNAIATEHMWMEARALLTELEGAKT